MKKRQRDVQNKIKIEQEQLSEIEEKYKFDWKLFRKYLQKKKIKHLYHFTDEENLKSIIESGGLFSWHYCVANKIEIKRPGGSSLSRQLDKKSTLEKYVHLSFTANHPMMYAALTDGRISKPVVLEIDSEVVFFKESLFSNKNANRTDAKIGNTFDEFSKIRFDIITSSDYLFTSEENKPYFQAEVLVRDRILLDQIKNIQKIKLLTP